MEVQGATFDIRVRILLLLTGLFVICLAVGDIISPKLTDVDLGPLHATMSVGMLAFPVTFVLTDLLNEFYGPRVARFVTFGAFGFTVFAYVLVTSASAMSWSAVTQSPDYNGVLPQEFEKVFNGSRRILVASLIAFLVGQLGDIWVFNRIKKATEHRMLWLRATGSTVVSQFVDTIVMQYIAWSGILPQDVIVRIIFSSYAVKFLVSVGLTPLLYVANAVLERRFGMRPAEV